MATTTTVQRGGAVSAVFGCTGGTSSSRCFAPGHVRAPRRSTGTDEGQGRGLGSRDALHGHVPEHSTPRRQSLSTFPLTSKRCLPPGSRPDRLFGVFGPQDRVQRRTVQQIVDIAPLPIIDDPAPQMVEELPDVLRFFRALSPDPSRLSKCPRSCLRTSLCERQLASRSWWNSWLKCPRLYPGPCCSR